jgi:DNA-binding transcriptional MerR regulator
MLKNKLFYSIKEVSSEIGVTSQTIRNWISEFPQLKVHREKTGRRMFTKNNIKILKDIKKQRNQGYTVKAIRKQYNKKIDEDINGIITKIDHMIKKIDRVI